MWKFGIRSHGFNTEPGWATDVEFGVKIPQGCFVQSAKAVLRELLGGNGNLRRYNGSRKSTKKGDHGNRGIGTESLNLVRWICLEEDISLATIISREGAWLWTIKSFGIHYFGEFLSSIEKGVEEWSFKVSERLSTVDHSGGGESLDFPGSSTVRHSERSESSRCQEGNIPNSQTPELIWIVRVWGHVSTDQPIRESNIRGIYGVVWRSLPESRSSEAPKSWSGSTPWITWEKADRWIPWVVR